jgi:hypothetical protein
MIAQAIPAGHSPFDRLGPMEGLRRLGMIVAVMTFAVVVISLFAGFQTAIGQPVALVLGILMGSAMVAVFLKVALVPERRYTGWVRGVTGGNARFVFTILLLAWILAMGFLASLNLGPNQLGAPALVGLFAGIFIFMGFIWAVIGE